MFKYGISNLKQFHWLTHDDMEFELGLKGPFWVEIFSNVNVVERKLQNDFCCGKAIVEGFMPAQCI